MNKDKILKYYIAHFIYMPLAVIYSLFIGEDLEVLILIFFLSLIVGFFAFGYNYVLTVIGLKVFKSKEMLAFTVPTIFLILLYVPATNVIQILDLGGEHAFLLILITSAVINISTFLMLKSKPS